MTITLRKRSSHQSAGILHSTVSRTCLAVAIAGSGCGFSSVAQAANFTASSEAELVSAINQANASGDASSTITLTGDFTVTASTALPVITSNITVDAAAHKFSTSGNPSLKTGSTGTLTISGDVAGSGVGGTDSGQFLTQGDGTVILSGASGGYASGIVVASGDMRIEGGSQIQMGNPWGLAVNLTQGDATLTISGSDTIVKARPGAATSSVSSSQGEVALTVEKGARFETNGLQVANTTGTKGTINVDGSGSRLVTTGVVNADGQSTFNITNGGRLETINTTIGGISAISRNGTGTIIISGKDSTWANSGYFYQYNGTMSVLDGGQLSAATTIRIAQASNNAASVLISGTGSEMQASGSAGIEIGNAGNGTLTVANGGKVVAQNGSAAIKLAGGTAGTGTGTINIGGGTGEAAAKAGTINASAIQFGPGKGTLNFNHIESDYDFDVALVGKGAINQIGSGKTTFNTDQSRFTGLTTVDAGTLVVNDKLGGSVAVNGGTLAINGTLNGPANVFGGILAVNGTVAGDVDVTGGRLQGIGTVGNTVNEAGGIVAPGNSIGTLTIDGNYTGKGGLLEIESVLGNDSSATDKLVVTGDTSGDTNVRVINLKGNGAPTVEGIRIIEVGARSDGTFALKGNYQQDGQSYVIAGAYAYGLYKNGVSNPADGDWYLRSTIMPQEPTNPGNGTPGGGTENPGVGNETDTPRYQPGIPVYEAYAQNLLAANGLPTLQQRVGNRYWGSSAGTGSDASQTSAAIWGRIEGAHGKFEPKSSATIDTLDNDVWKMQAGLDGQFIETESGKLIGGLVVQYANVSTDVASELFGDGRIDTDGYGFGGTLTWYGNDGFYVDGQAQATWYRSDLFSDIANAGLTGDNDGFGYAFSMETGKRFAASGNWTLTPQAQLIYSAIDFDSFNGIIDSSSTRVSLDRGNSLQGRLGLSADYETSWTGADGKLVRTHAYAIANLYREFLNGTRIQVDGTGFTTENERTWGGIGTGGSYDWADGKYKLYGELAVNTSLHNFGNSYTLNGTAGFKVAF